MAAWCLLAALVALLVEASCAAGALPPSWHDPAERGAAGSGSIPVLHIALSDPHAFLSANQRQLGLHARNILAVASPGFKEVDAAARGQWRTDAAGRHLRLSIRSAGSASQTLLFSELRIPDGGTLWLYVPSARIASNCSRQAGCVVLKPSSVPFHGKYTSQSFDGPEVVLEYSEPRQVNGSWGVPVFRILHVMQGFGGFLAELPAQPPGARRLADDQEQDEPKGSQFDVARFPRQRDWAEMCTPGAECHPELAREAAAVVAIFVVDLVLGVIGACTGTFVTTSGALGQTRYVLTANHCFTSRHPDDFQYWTLVFNYDARCGLGQPGPTPTHAVQGVKLVFYDDASDLMLLQQLSEIPRAYAPYFLGYNADPSFTPAEAYAIHHPGGNAKRVTYANRTVSSKFPDAPFPDTHILPTSDTHLKVVWTRGSTQGGSSGAALVDAASRRIVGVLTGGFASCSRPFAADYFGRISVAWENGLAAYLALAATGEQVSAAIGAPAFSSAAALEDWQRYLDDVAGVGARGAVADLDRTMSELAAYNASGYVADGQEYTFGRPGMEVWPSVGVAFADQPLELQFLTGLSDAPAEGEVMHLQAAALNLPGNSVRASDVVSISPAELLFTAANFTAGSAGLISVNYTREGPVPGGMLRLLLLLKLTSSKDSNFMLVQTVKAIFWSDATARESVDYVSNTSAVDVPSLPYHALSPVASESGKALWRIRPARNATFNTLVCLQRGLLVEAAVSMYRDGILAWTQAYQNNTTRVSGADCIVIEGNYWTAGDDCLIAIHDADWFAAVLDMAVVRQLSIVDAAADTLRIAPQLLRPAGAPAPSPALAPAPAGMAEPAVGAPIWAPQSV